MPAHACRPISHAWLKNVSCCRLAWHNSQKYVNSDPCKDGKPCVKWINHNNFLAISDFSREKHQERARVYTRAKTSEDFGRLRKSSDFFGRLRRSSGIFGNDRVVFKIPGTSRIKIACLYLRKSWQVYKYYLKCIWSEISISLFWKVNILETLLQSSNCVWKKLAIL